MKVSFGFEKTCRRMGSSSATDGSRELKPKRMRNSFARLNAVPAANSVPSSSIAMLRATQCLPSLVSRFAAAHVGGRACCGLGMPSEGQRGKGRWVASLWVVAFFLGADDKSHRKSQCWVYLFLLLLSCPFFFFDNTRASRLSVSTLW